MFKEQAWQDPLSVALSIAKQRVGLHREHSYVGLLLCVYDARFSDTQY